ncbi:unnamed protein product [Ixodes hexagonus]
MDHRNWYLLASVAWAILTSGGSIPLSDIAESRNITISRSPRSLFTQKGTEESLKSCLVQSGFANVHCHTENGFVRCLSGGFDHTPTGNIIATALGVAVGVICVAGFGCCCWTMSGRRKARAGAVLQIQQPSLVLPAQGNTAIGFANPMATPAHIGSGFHRH